MIFWLTLCCGCQGVLLTIQNQWQLRHLRTIDNYSPLYCLSPTSPTSSLTADYFHISLLLIMWRPSVLYTTTQTQHPPKEFSNVLCACNMSLRPDPLPPFTGDLLNIGNPCNPSAQNNQHSIQQLKSISYHLWYSVWWTIELYHLHSPMSLFSWFHSPGTANLYLKTLLLVCEGPSSKGIRGLKKRWWKCFM